MPYIDRSIRISFVCTRACPCFCNCTFCVSLVSQLGFCLVLRNRLSRRDTFNFTCEMPAFLSQWISGCCLLKNKQFFYLSFLEISFQHTIESIFHRSLKNCCSCFKLMLNIILSSKCRPSFYILPRLAFTTIHTTALVKRPVVVLL